jgi:hypothetical protein
MTLLAIKAARLLLAIADGLADLAAVLLRRAARR